MGDYIAAENFLDALTRAARGETMLVTIARPGPAGHGLQTIRLGREPER
jgi:hypothetical protein